MSENEIDQKVKKTGRLVAILGGVSLFLAVLVWRLTKISFVISLVIVTPLVFIGLAKLLGISAQANLSEDEKRSMASTPRTDADLLKQWKAATKNVHKSWWRHVFTKASSSKTEEDLKGLPKVEALPNWKGRRVLRLLWGWGLGKVLIVATVAFGLGVVIVHYLTDILNWGLTETVVWVLLVALIVLLWVILPKVLVRRTIIDIGDDKKPNSVVRGVLVEAITDLKGIYDAIETMQTPAFQKRFCDLYRSAYGVVKGVGENPETYNNVRRLMTYYIPSLARLAQGVQKLEEKKQASSDRIKNTYHILDELKPVFSNYVDQVNQPDVSSLDLELKLLESEIKSRA